MFRQAWTHPKAYWASLAVAALGLGAVGVWVDLSPKVESDFFFSEDDPQLQVSNELNRRYRGGGEELVVVRAEDTAGDPEVYRERISDERLRAVVDVVHRWLFDAVPLELRR